jgi:hypothetical protein
LVHKIDPRFNNMLFNFETATSTQPKKVLLLDFQLSAFTHPGNDLAYFLLTSTTPEFRADHLDSVFKGYFETLHGVVKEAGIGDFSYTMEQLQEDYKVRVLIYFIGVVHKGRQNPVAEMESKKKKRDKTEGVKMCVTSYIDGP